MYMNKTSLWGINGIFEVFTALISEVQVNGFLPIHFFGLSSAVLTHRYFKLTYDITNASTFGLKLLSEL